MEIFDEVITPLGEKGVVWLLGGFPQANVAYIEADNHADAVVEYYHFYDATLMDTIIKPLVKYNITDLRFFGHSTVNNTSAIVVGKLVIDRERHKVIYDGEEIKLPKKEMDILVMLALRPDTVVTRERIIEEVWGGNVTDDKTLNVHVCKLRRRIPTIETVSGAGYKISE